MSSRIDSVKQTVEQVAAICGLSAASVCVGGDIKTGCRLTRSGIDLMVNHELNEDIASRSRYGVRGEITLDQVDVMTACFVASRAQDYLLDDWRRRVEYGKDLTDYARRYIQASVDDMAAYARIITRIPFARQHFEAYLSRMAAHVMSSEPLHLQFIRALRLYIFEAQPQIVISPTVTEELGIITAMNPLVADMKALLFDDSLPYVQRHERAAEILARPFARMLKLDEDALSFYDIMHLYDNEQSYGASKEAAEDENVLRQEADSVTRAQSALATVNEGNIDQLIADNNQTNAVKTGTPNLNLPSMPAETGAMIFSEGNGLTYESAVLRRRATIEDIAEVLVRIATPQEQLSIPRYSARLAHTGSRMHPGALVNALMQLESGHEKAIWQKVRRKTRLQNLQFKGLDIYLLLDVSISMTGENAESAATLAVCLIEGIGRAIEMVSEDRTQGDVDIRTQLLAFGEGWAELTPRATVHEQGNKQFAFSQILHPTSEQTLIAAALRQVQDYAEEDSSRDIVCLVIGDGLFADGLQARKCAMGLPENVYLAHINIGEYSGLPLSRNFETIQDPSVLPEKLRSVLAHHLKE